LPWPYAVHSAPYTRHPTPCTLHPAPCTLFILPPFPHPTVNPLCPTRHVLETSFYALHTTSKGNLGTVCLETDHHILLNPVSQTQLHPKLNRKPALQFGSGYCSECRGVSCGCTSTLEQQCTACRRPRVPKIRPLSVASSLHRPAGAGLRV